jgi:hypothetical protein
MLRHTSVVVFEVDSEAPGATLNDLVNQVFSRTAAVRLRSGSTLVYQSGDYRREEDDIWTGRIDRLREGSKSAVSTDASGAYIFAPSSTETITTSQSTSYYAYDPARRLLAYQDTAEIPYTRMESYVRAAARGAGAEVSLEPRKLNRTIEGWLSQFTTVDRVTVKYRHSQSPGNLAIDQALEALNAEKGTQTVVAREREALNKEALLSTDNPIGIALDHLNQAASNGRAMLYGYVGSERIRVDTSDPVERHMLDFDDTLDALRPALGRLLARLLPNR